MQLGFKGGLSARFFQMRRDTPVFFRFEGLDGVFAFAYQFQRDRLHPARAEPESDLVPENFTGKLEAHDSVQLSAGLLRVHFFLIDSTGFLERLLHRPFRDLVESHPIEFALGPGSPEEFLDVPGNRLTLAVRVGGQINLLRRRSRPAQLVDGLCFSLNDAVIGLEIVLNVYSHFALAGFHQIPHVAPRCEDVEIPAQELLDGAHFRRRFHDQELGRGFSGIAPG